jgi:hypothetical protein
MDPIIAERPASLEAERAALCRAVSVPEHASEQVLAQSVAVAEAAFDTARAVRLEQDKIASRHMAAALALSGLIALLCWIVPERRDDLVSIWLSLGCFAIGSADGRQKAIKRLPA